MGETAKKEATSPLLREGKGEEVFSHSVGEWYSISFNSKKAFELGRCEKE